MSQTSELVCMDCGEWLAGSLGKDVLVAHFGPAPDPGFAFLRENSIEEGRCFADRRSTVATRTWRFLEHFLVRHRGHELRVFRELEIASLETPHWPVYTEFSQAYVEGAPDPVYYLSPVGVPDPADDANRVPASVVHRLGAMSRGENLPMSSPGDTPKSVRHDREFPAAQPACVGETNYVVCLDCGERLDVGRYARFVDPNLAVNLFGFVYLTDWHRDDENIPEADHVRRRRTRRFMNQFLTRHRGHELRVLPERLTNSYESEDWPVRTEFERAYLDGTGKADGFLFTTGHTNHDADERLVPETVFHRIRGMSRGEISPERLPWDTVDLGPARSRMKDLWLSATLAHYEGLVAGLKGRLAGAISQIEEFGGNGPESALLLLESHANLSAMLSWFRDGDAAQLRFWSYVAGRVKRVLWQSFSTCSIHDLLLPLLAGDEALLQWISVQSLMFTERAMQDMESFSYLDFQIVLALRGAWKEVGNRAHAFLTHVPLHMAEFSVDQRFLLALARGERTEMENALVEMTDPGVAWTFRRSNAHEKGLFFRSLPVIYMKIANRAGFDLPNRFDFVPNAWFQASELVQINPPYAFLRKFDLGQPLNVSDIEFRNDALRRYRPENRP